MKQHQLYYEEYWDSGLEGWSPRNIQMGPLERMLIDRYILPNSRVLDYGCGNCSRYSSYVESRGAKYIGLDISLAAIRECKSQGRSALIHDSNFPIPFLSNWFDVVLCTEVLEHLFRPDIALQEIVRVLKPGGVIIASVPNIAWLGNRLLMLAGFFNPGGSPATSLRAPWKDPHIRFFSKQSLLKLLNQELNLSIIEFTGTEFYIADLPLLYKISAIRKFLDWAGLPVKSLGHLWPSLFASHLFVVARKSDRVDM